jgi:glycosyltransferase involved in cell wall biosynthesis
MSLEILIAAMLMCSVGPAALFVLNLQRYRRPRASTRHVPSVSVLIPARNEEANIGECLTRVLASRFAQIEVLVMDDASTDRTGEIIAEIAASDPRVRVLKNQELPPGWNGKQHACWLLAQQATMPLLLFLDADVRVEPEAISRCAAAKRRARNSPELVSGFPQQVMEGWTERMLLPLIHFELLGYRRLSRMRRSPHPRYAAGSGQFVMAERTAYFESGGHAAIKKSQHDGIRLPFLFRARGFTTDVVDLTDLAFVHTYASAGEVWKGLSRQAGESLGSPVRVVGRTLVMFLGQVAPAVLLLMIGITYVALRLHGGNVELVDPAGAWMLLAVLLAAVIAGYLPRFLATDRFRHPVTSAMLHPLGVTMLLTLHWYVMGQQVFGRQRVGRRQKAQPALR